MLVITTLCIVYIYIFPTFNKLLTLYLSVFLLLEALIVALWASGLPSLNKYTYLPTRYHHSYFEYPAQNVVTIRPFLPSSFIYFDLNPFLKV